MTDIVSNWNVYGLEDSIKASKYSMAVDVDKCTPDITDTVKKLAGAAPGTGLDQFLTGIIVQFDLKFSIKAWAEAERYHFLEFVSSQSTMHRVAKLDVKKQCNEYVDADVIAVVERKIKTYENDPTPENYLKLLYNIPTGYTLTARMTTNARQLKTIYQQRKNHRLPEWRLFCKWIEGLPCADFITYGSGFGD